jgi:hypothetical protein
MNFDKTPASTPTSDYALWVVTSLIGLAYFFS